MVEAERGVVKLKSEYDVIVIGAGVAGLTCANYLAKSGLSVLLLEKHYIAGGYCSSFQRKGFYFDAAAHYLSSCRENGQLGRLFRDHDLLRLLSIRRWDPSDIIMMPDYRIKIRTSFEGLLTEFQENFPHEAKGLRSLFEFIAKTDTVSLFVQLRRRRDATFADVLDEHVEDNKLKASLSILLGNIGLPSIKTSALSGVFLFREFIFDGGYYPKGGMQAFCDALTERFTSYGGTVSFLTPAQSIVMKNESVVGVLIKGKQFIGAKYVVSTCDPHQTYSALLSGYHNDHIMKKLRQSQPSISAFMLHLGTRVSLKDTVKDRCCIWYYPGYDIDQCYLDWLEGRVNFERGFVFASFPSFHDPDLAPQGKDSVQIIIGTAHKEKEFWEENKESFAEKVIRQAEAFIPSLSANIEVKCIATPLTLAKYTWNYHGAMYGWASTPEQVADARFPETSPVNSLYLAGHWSWPFAVAGQGGIPMAVYSGRVVANRIRRDVESKADFVAAGPVS